jgi:hypothetical protein
VCEMQAKEPSTAEELREAAVHCRQQEETGKQARRALRQGVGASALTIPDNLFWRMGKGALPWLGMLEDLPFVPWAAPRRSSCADDGDGDAAIDLAECDDERVEGSPPPAGPGRKAEELAPLQRLATPALLPAVTVYELLESARAEACAVGRPPRGLSRVLETRANYVLAPEAAAWATMRVGACCMCWGLNLSRAALVFL